MHRPFTEVDRWEAMKGRAEANPYGLPDTHLYLSLRDLELQDRHDIRTAEGAAAVRSIVDRRLRAEPGLRATVEHDREDPARHFANFGSPQVFGGRIPVHSVSEPSD